MTSNSLFPLFELNWIQMKFKQSVTNLNVNVNVNILSAGLHKTVWSMTIEVIQTNVTKSIENRQRQNRRHYSKANTEQCKAEHAL